MKKFVAILIICISVFTIIGCGGGGGGGASAPITSQADQDLIASVIGNWKLSQASKNGILVPVLPNSSGNVGTITFNSDGTANSTDYTLTTYYSASPGSPASENNSYQTTNDPPAISGGTWTASAGKLYTTSSTGETFVNSVEIRNGELYQTMSDGTQRVWKR
ncbi:MAG TPA: hypothetical protein PKI71_00515 [Candidatus Rifleibacterium sp.]|nr:hypothetical protein [Candidatus Rifleibacterium sp.]